MSRNVLITGSTSGIGLGIAEAFAKNGDNIVFNGLEENGAEIAKSIGEKYGVKSVFKNSNLMTPEGVQELVVVENSRHGIVLDQAKKLNQELLKFL